MNELEILNSRIKDFIKKNYKKSFNEPKGDLRHKFLEPASAYRGQLWDWDSFFCGLALIDVYDNTYEYVKGCALNFLDHQRDDGSIPYMIDVSGGTMEALPKLGIKVRDENSDLNSIKPLLAQMILLVAKKDDDILWIKNNYHKLQKHIIHWEQTQKIKNGLFVWRSYRGSGTDNHPALYGRPLNSSVGVELNCFMYIEYIAMSKIAEKLGKGNDAGLYIKKSKELAKAINENMWDPIDRLYYNLDALSVKPPLARQEVFWNVPLKFRVWTCFVPMYVKIAPEDYACDMVKLHLMNPDEFYSDYGLRTIAKNEPIYNTVESSNPSNWQGPIWVVSTYIMFKGLLNYGYVKEAAAVAGNLLNVLVNDIDKNGAMHEYYNPETGNSNINLGFMNWNALSGLMVDEIKRYTPKQSI